MKRFFVIGIVLCILVSFVSCNAKDDPNALLDTQFAAEVIDSSHILSPKTYSYLHNVKPPLGVKPVVVVVEKIENSQMGTYADDLFDQFCEKKYSGNTFRKRGVLIVASKSPELIQIRVGKTYDVYCRMRGSAAGADYLSMQKECSIKGIDEMCPVAFRNVIEDIEHCRELPWYKKMALKVSFMHVDILMDDLATPSDSFFSQFYFRPFLYVVGGIKSIFGSWILSFLFIAILYTLLKNWAENKINTYLAKKIEQESQTDNDREFYAQVYYGIKLIGVFLLKLIVTIPTLAAISILSSARMEDIMTLEFAHIPSVNVMESVTSWSNDTPGVWIVLLLMMVYYMKFLFCGPKGSFTLAHVSDKVQQYKYQTQAGYRRSLDARIKYGYNRRLIQGMLKIVGCFLPSVVEHHNFHEIDTTTIDNHINDTDDEGKPKEQLFDLFFLSSDSPEYRTSPALALQINTHREALYLTFFVGIVAITLLSFTYVVYFLVLWLVQLVCRIVSEYYYSKKNLFNSIKELDLTRLVKRVWLTDVIFYMVMLALLFALSTSYTPKDIEPVAEVRKALPDDFGGLYFVPKADGENVKGVTARIIQDNTGSYFLQVYSDKPMRRFGLILDEEAGVFHSDILGDGYITYDEQTKTIEINFSDLWILTN